MASRRCAECMVGRIYPAKEDTTGILEDEVRNFRARFQFSGEVKRRKIKSVTFVSKDTSGR